MIAAVFMFVVYLVVFGILFWICDYAAANFLPAEFAPKAHVILVDFVRTADSGVYTQLGWSRPPSLTRIASIPFLGVL